MPRSRLQLIVWFRIMLVMLACAATARADGPYEEPIARFRQWAEERLQRDHAPGLSIGFIKDQFTWAEGFGFADLENRIPARAESAYRLASVTKPMTAIGVLKLVEEGRVDLDAEVQTYVPFYPRKPWPITVRQVLGHLGGISHYRNYDLEGHFKDHKDTRESIAVFADFDLVAEPGTRYQYSCYGYNLLGAVIEGASGQPYGRFMREHLWGPLGMEATRMDDPEALIPHRVRGYRRGPDGGLINSEFVDISSRFAAGGTRSTVIDLLKFARGLNEGRVLSAPLVELMLTPMATRDGASTGYGMGWGIRPINGRFCCMHGGGQAETATYLIWFPDEKLAIAAAMNLERGERMTYVRRLYEEVMGEPWLPPVYAGGPAEQAVHRALQMAWAEGLSRVEHTGTPLIADPDGLREAFGFFNSAVALASRSDEDETARQRLGEVSNPSGRRLVQAVGSSMAARLLDQADAETIRALHRDGAIRFFHEYVQLYRRGDDIPQGYRFDPALESLIARWQRDWARTWNERTYRFDLSESADVESALARMQELFAGASVYPDHWGTLEERVETLARAGRLDEALKIAEAGRELYPKSGAPHFHAGLIRLARGEREAGTELIRRAAEVDPGAAGAGALNTWAYQLKSAGFFELGLELLDLAVEMHPHVANLYDSLGEFYLEKSIGFYRRALEVDPEFENARRMLRQISAGGS